MKVCIIGSGLSSLTLAKALVNQKIHVDIFSSKKIIKPNNSRTVGITKSNVEYFNSNIINLKKIGWKLDKIEIFSEHLKNEKILNFKNNKEQLFSIFKNDELYKYLEKSLLKNKFFKKKYTEKFSLLSSEYDLVFNTNYVNFFTNKYFSNRTLKRYNSFAYTTIIKHEKTFNRTAIQIFTKFGPLAFLPISDNETSIVYSLNGIKKISNADFITLIKKYNYKYKIIKINKINSFELISLNLRTYYYKNILAFGDLLHRIHPLAGQGFNMTIRDIKTLIDILKNKFDLGLSLDKSVNKEFEQKMRHKNLIFSNGIDFLSEFFKIEAKTKNDILTKSIKLIGNRSVVNKFFLKIADKGLSN